LFIKSFVNVNIGITVGRELFITSLLLLLDERVQALGCIH